MWSARLLWALFLCGLQQRAMSVLRGPTGVNIHIDVSIRSSQTTPHALNISRKLSPPQQPNPPPRRVAVLVSGQIHRFLWRDSFSHAGGLSRLLGCKDSTSKCDVVADMFIALQESPQEPWFHPDPVLPPYSKNWSSGQVVQYFENMGARHVSLQMISDEQLAWDGREDAVKNLGSTQENMTSGAWWASVEQLSRGDSRWKLAGRMWYQRHFAYAAALRRQAQLAHAYTEFLFLRDDNVFYLEDYPRAINAAFPSSQTPTVFVDEFCGFGAYSDKIYWADPAGAAVLFFGDSDESFRDTLVAWLIRGLHSAASDPLQPEGWIAQLLREHNVSLNTTNFGRADMRFTNQSYSSFCSTYHWCTLEQIQALIKAC